MAETVGSEQQWVGRLRRPPEAMLSAKVLMSKALHSLSEHGHSRMRRRRCLTLIGSMEDRRVERDRRVKLAEASAYIEDINRERGEDAE